MIKTKKYRSGLQSNVLEFVEIFSIAVNRTKI